MSKEELRAEALYSRRKISISQLARESLLVQENLAAQDEYREAKLVVCYVSRDYEVQTTGIIVRMLAEGKRVAVPLVDDPSHSLLFFGISGLDELSPGRFGVLEPGRGSERVTLSETDLVLVPLVAWDDRGHRIGYGRGYFDRALAMRGPSLAIGLALESQHIQTIPEVPSDVSMDVVVTEKRVLRFARSSV
ncbi:MAG: 5-formyltetrahydrofolate cyclo-ligase [Nitrososphaerales archaeon]|jgi:5-formyltetrahydrofolate cyclo-ligase